MMAALEQIARGAAVRGILPHSLVTIADVRWIGTVAIEVTYKDNSGKLGNELIYRDREASLEIVEAGRPWSFDGDSALFRLVSEANRIRLAHLFDPLLAVHTSLVEPLPHQITAVYGVMIDRHPLHFVLADDPGAGKTIMTGLFIKELMARGDLQRCLIVCPGNLVEQWQDELDKKFHLPFDILTNDALEAARTGNWFTERSLVICRLDKLSRDEDAQAKLAQTDWDLIVCDEAHKLSATYFGNEVKYTKRYRLGQLLATRTRHFLLLTATPHNGKEEDFQLFMALLDNDRFEGKFREGVPSADTSDMMRRLVKEKLLKFDGTPLFPERIASTIDYELSEPEYDLYDSVTRYVCNEFDRAAKLGHEGRKGTVGFALTVLQRRLASSPEAIYQSLRRRRERLEKRLHETLSGAVDPDLNRGLPSLTEDDLEDLDEAPDAEVEETEEEVLDQATAARTVAELRIEIAHLAELEEAAHRVRASGTDRKWDELSTILQDRAKMVDAEGHRRKLVIFTEHRDTLTYLAQNIGALLGRPEAIVVIHGGLGREQRRDAEEAFKFNKDVEVLVATDAAGEGINLQAAHLMVNYDLPWNPNRLEQRFGRIHRIGQTEVCHLWNLVAKDTREGEVYLRLLEKINTEKEALGGQVFDVLGQLRFGDRSLRDLMIDAVRYNERPDVKAKLLAAVDMATERAHLQELIESRALTHDSMDVSKVRAIREDMERADARRLQPHFIGSFFLEAFRRLGGTIHERESKRYEIKHVPAAIRNRTRIGGQAAIQPQYIRAVFDKHLVNVPGKPSPAAFLCPGNAILDTVIEILLERDRDLLKRGAILIDDNNPGDEPRVLLYLEHAIQDAGMDRSGNRRTVSRRMQFVELDAAGNTVNAGSAPYLDYRAPNEQEAATLAAFEIPEWIGPGIETRAIEYAAIHIVPDHMSELRRRKEELLDKTRAAVNERLTREIHLWDRQAQKLKDQELAGKVNAKLNSGLARQRADDLQGRLNKRLEEIERERQLSPLPPVVSGGALIIPAALLAKLGYKPSSPPPDDVVETEESERRAMAAVMATETRLGFVPRDVSEQNCGYDIESRVPGTGHLRFIEVKGRTRGAQTVTVTSNEIRTAINEPDQFVLALVVLDPDRETVRYLCRPFEKEPDFTAASVNYYIAPLLSRSTEPS